MFSKLKKQRAATDWKTIRDLKTDTKGLRSRSSLRWPMKADSKEKHLSQIVSDTVTTVLLTTFS